MTQDTPKPTPKILVALDGGSLAAWLPVSLLNAPAYRVMTLSAHRVLGRVLIARAHGHHHIRHWEFIEYGVARDSVTHAINELEMLGILTVQRHEPKANSYGLSDRYREIATLADARRIRDKARDFGIFRRRKHERALARIKRQHHQTERTSHDDEHDDDRNQDAGPAALGDDAIPGLCSTEQECKARHHLRRG